MLPIADYIGLAESETCQLDVAVAAVDDGDYYVA